VDVRLVLDRAAERDRQGKGGEQGCERAWPRSQPQISNRKSAKAVGVAGKIRHVNEEPKPESSPEAP
jgi:hypothetical protein